MLTPIPEGVRINPTKKKPFWSGGDERHTLIVSHAQVTAERLRLPPKGIKNVMGINAPQQTTVDILSTLPGGIPECCADAEAGCLVTAWYA